MQRHLEKDGGRRGEKGFVNIPFIIEQGLTWKMVLRFLQRPMLKEVLAMGK